MRTINIKDEKPFAFFTLDVETHGLNAKAFKFMGVYNDKFGYLCFRTPAEFIEWLANLEEPIYAYAYNAEYDLSSCFDNILFDLADTVISGGRFIFGRYANVTFADAANLFQSARSEKTASLKEIAEKYGLKKTEIPETLLQSTDTEISEEEISYNRNDCEILFFALSKLFESFQAYSGSPPRALTLAQNSMSIWQHAYSDSVSSQNGYGRYIEVCELDKQFQEAYKGGRTEVWRRGRMENATLYDVHSMYPSVMRGAYPHPSFLRLRNRKHISQQDFAEILQSNEGMAYGYATIPESEHYGAIPLTWEDKLVFPVGTIQGAWCFPEIRYLLSIGGSFEFTDVIWSDETIYPFKEFVEYFYTLRKTTTSEAEKYQTKILLNSLYGKFGAQGLEKRKYQRIRTPFKGSDMWQWIPLNPLDLNGMGWWQSDAEEPWAYNSIFEFAAYTTSYARVKHAQGIRASNAFYGDTDSVFCRTGDFPQDLMHSDELGLWGIDKEFEWIEFYAPKSYQGKLKEGTYDPEKIPGGLIQKCKGVPKRYPPGLCPRPECRGKCDHGPTADLFDNISKGERGIRIQRLTKSTEAARRGLQAGTPVTDRDGILGIYKRMAFTDKKRRWHNDGASNPHRFEIRDHENFHLCCGEDEE